MTRALAAEGLVLTDARVHKSLLDIEVTRAKVPRGDLMQLCTQLAVFLRAGVPIVEAIDVIRQEAGNRLLREALADMGERIEAGESFSATAGAHPELFPDMNVSMLRSAELTGHLDGVLEQLARYIERDMEARRKITSALVYPGVVLVMSVVAAVVLTVWVLPRFKAFFASLNARLPLPTRMLLAIARWFQDWWYVPAGIVVLLLAVGFYLARSESGRRLRDRLLLRLPLVNGVVRDSIIERFCRILAATSSAGVPLPDALSVAADGTNNHVYRQGVYSVLHAMLAGQGIAGPLGELGLFPPAARQMIRVGEDTGSLGAQLEIAARYFDRQLDYRLKRLTTLFEPAVILFMGILVGFVAIALISAMYGIFSQVQVPH